MEFFALARCALSEDQLRQAVTGLRLDACCASIDRVLWWEEDRGEIYCLWGQFHVRRELIRGGLRFTLPDCPNALAWTLTMAAKPDQPDVSRAAGVQIHCTINRTEHEPDFVDSIETFVDDWRVGLERLVP
jgi:hypothetical protein